MRRRIEYGKRVTVYVDDGELVKHAPVIRAVLRRLGVRAEDLDDAIQDTLAAAWSSMCAGRFRPWKGQPLAEALGAWLTGIARHLAADKRAQDKGRRDIARAHPHGATAAKAVRSSPEDQLAAREALRVLRQLRPELVEVLEHAALGRTLIETAAALGIPRGTAATRLRSGRRELRRLLADPHQHRWPRRQARAVVTP